MKLNLAHGTHPFHHPEWLNVDLPWHGVVGADVYGNAFALPFRCAAFEACYLGHVLEHIERPVIPVFMAEVRRVLPAGATVMVVGPDSLRAHEQGQPQELLDAIDTLNDGPGGHKWVAHEANTIEAMLAGGLVDVRALPVEAVRPPAWPNPVPDALWQCAAMGIVP